MQYFANAVISGAFIFIVSVGFFLVLRVNRFLNFTHGLFVALAGYLVLLFTARAGIPMWGAVSLALFLTGLAGYGLERVLHAPLRGKGASSLEHLVASIGMFEAGQNLIAIAFGDQTSSFRSAAVQEGWIVAGARITPVQAASVAVAAAVFVSVWLVMRHTRVGLRWEAVSSDLFLAKAQGIDAERVQREVMVTSAVIASIGGILIGSDGPRKWDWHP